MRSVRAARATFTGDAPELAKLLAQLGHKIGHEIGNPLTSIISLATIIERFSEPGSDKNQQYARSIISEAWKISNLVEKFVLLFSERAGNQSICALDEALRRTLNKLKSRGAYDLDDIILRVEDEVPPTAHVDLDQLCTILAELLANACDASQSGSSAAASNPDGIELTGDPIIVRLYSVGSCSCVEVINPIKQPSSHELAELFQPLVTTSPTQKSLGIGLSVVSKIAKRFGGLSEIEEVLLDGDRLHFVARLVLPATETASIGDWDRAEADTRPELPKQKTEVASTGIPEELRVLVVEDQQMVASAIRKILEFALKDHSKVTCDCVTGVEAVEMISDGEAFDVILCDLNLNSMSGKKIYEILSRDQPEQLSRFAYMTGELRPDIDQEIPCLKKPFEPEELIRIVLELLQR